MHPLTVHGTATYSGCAACCGRLPAVHNKHSYPVRTSYCCILREPLCYTMSHRDTCATVYSAVLLCTVYGTHGDSMDRLSTVTHADTRCAITCRHGMHTIICYDARQRQYIPSRHRILYLGMLSVMHRKCTC